MSYLFWVSFNAVGRGIILTLVTYGSPRGQDEFKGLDYDDASCLFAKQPQPTEQA